MKTIEKQKQKRSGVRQNTHTSTNKTLPTMPTQQNLPHCIRVYMEWHVMYLFLAKRTHSILEHLLLLVKHKNNFIPPSCAEHPLTKTTHCSTENSKRNKDSIPVP
jgi:hypothetical protein